MQEILLFILFAVLAEKKVDDTYDKYCNDRFAFCVEYPKQFKSDPPPENDDGLSFKSPDGQSTIWAFGSLAIEDFDKLDQEFEIATKDISLTYKHQEKNWFIFSGITNDNKIVYQKTRKTSINYFGQPGTAVFQTLMIEYPPNQAKIYNSYCQKIANSFR